MNSNLSTREITFSAACVALLAVSAWVTVPFGPVPFTLQTLALVFVLVAMPGRTSILSVGMYVLLGGAGVPLFSGMRGGLGVLFGPTGGFILGFLLAAVLAAVLRRLMPEGGIVRDVATAVLAIVCSHAVGVCWLATVGGYSLAAAFAAGSAPFIALDAIKACVGVGLAKAVRAAVPSLAA